MFEVGIYEAKTHLPKLIQRVRQGESGIITYRGKPVARVVPVESEKERIAEAWRKLRENTRKKCVRATLEEMIAWKNEGRP